MSANIACASKKGRRRNQLAHRMWPSLQVDPCIRDHDGPIQLLALGSNEAGHVTKPNDPSGAWFSR